MRFGSVGGVREAGQGGPYLEVRQPQPGDSFGRPRPLKERPALAHFADRGIPGMTEDGFILVNGWFWNL